MSKPSSITHQTKPARTAKRPGRSGSLDGSHNKDGTTRLVPVAIRIEKRQREALDKLSAELMMHKADIIRKGMDLVLVWGAERLVKLGR